MRGDLERKLDQLLRDPVLSKVDLAEIYAKAYVKEAIDLFVEIMRDEDQAPSLRMKAAQALLERGFGKPAVAIRVSQDDRSKEDSQRTIEAEILEATEKAESIMRLARQGGQAPDQWSLPE